MIELTHLNLTIRLKKTIYEVAVVIDVIRKCLFYLQLVNWSLLVTSCLVIDTNKLNPGLILVHEDASVAKIGWHIIFVSLSTMSQYVDFVNNFS